MSSYVETKNQLILNLLDKDTYASLSGSGQLGLNELYLIQGDDANEVVDVKYISSASKFVYVTEDGQTVDIVTIANLKTLLDYATVASSGQYADLTGKPSINGVTLSGNKTTSDLNIALSYNSDAITNKPTVNGVTLTGDLTTQQLSISYDDLDDLPSIPSVSSTYVQGDTGAALTSKGVDGALENYVPKTRTVQGSGALGGGGSLSSDLTITHNSGPTGLTTAAKKIGVDQYGHACLGSDIAASDVGAIPLKSTTVTSGASLDGSNVSIVVLGNQSETLGFSTAPELGKPLVIQYVNTSDSAIDLTIPSNLTDVTYYNGNRITAAQTVSVPGGSCVKIDVLVTENQGTSYSFINLV